MEGINALELVDSLPYVIQALVYCKEVVRLRAEDSKGEDYKVLLLEEDVRLVNYLLFNEDTDYNIEPCLSDYTVHPEKPNLVQKYMDDLMYCLNMGYFKDRELEWCKTLFLTDPFPQGNGITCNIIYCALTGDTFWKVFNGDRNWYLDFFKSAGTVM